MRRLAQGLVAQHYRLRARACMHPPAPACHGLPGVNSPSPCASLPLMQLLIWCGALVSSPDPFHCPEAQGLAVLTASRSLCLLKAAEEQGREYRQVERLCWPCMHPTCSNRIPLA